MPRTSEESLKLLTDVVWEADGNEGNARLTGIRRSASSMTSSRRRLGARRPARSSLNAGMPLSPRLTGASRRSISRSWHIWCGMKRAKKNPKLKHPLAPLISAWQSGPLEVQAVRTSDGNLRADVIMPRVAMRRNLNSGRTGYT